MPRGKRKRGAKTQAAREMMASMPNATASAIVNALAEKGMRIAPQLIYSLRAREGQAAKTAARTRAVRGRPSNSWGGSNSLSQVTEILGLVDRIGVDRAKRILEAVER